MRTGAQRILVVLATLLLAAGLWPGVVDREVLDGSTFADHANKIRMDDRVSTLIGVAITAQVLAADPDLVAVRPAMQP